jgi:short-subunit dehydrogenase
MASRFARGGAVLLISDRDPALVESVVSELRASGARATGFPLDVTDEDQIAEAREQIHAEGGPIDVLVNNAGTVFGGAFLTVPAAKHLTTAAVNFSGLMAVTHAFLPDLIGRPESHLVNIVSASAFVALPYGTSYAATKWAVLGFTESLREELRVLGHTQVGVTAVCPSYVDTGLFRGAQTPAMTTMLKSEDVAEAVFHAVRLRRERVVMPFAVRLVSALTCWLPWPLYRRLGAALGTSTTMAGWQGHETPVSAGK